MKNTMQPNQIFFAFLAGILVLSACSTAQMGHSEWDDSYFNSSDKARISYQQNSNSGSPTSTNYPNANQYSGSINNYPDNQQSVNNFNNQYSINPNADQASANYVNPDYRASGPLDSDQNSNSNTQNSSAGTTYITNNYYDTDNYYRSNNRSYFSPYSTLGMGFGFSPGISIGFGFGGGWGYQSSFGFYSGWGNPYFGFGYNPWRFNRWGMGWNTWGYNSCFDPFWGFGYSPIFYNPYWAYRNYYSPFYNYGPAWSGNQGSGQDNRNIPSTTSNPRTNMSGNFNPNQVSTPGTSNTNYIPPSTGGRNRGERGEPGGQPVNPNPGNNPNSNPVPNRGNNMDNNVPVRPTPTEPATPTPRQYQPVTNPDSYSPNPTRGQRTNSQDGFNQSPSQPGRNAGSYNNYPTANPDPRPQAPVTMPSRTERRYSPPSQPGDNPFRSGNEGFRQQNSNGGGWFRSGGNSSGNSNFGGSGFGGSNRGGNGGGSFTPPASGGRKRGQ